MEISSTAVLISVLLTVDIYVAVNTSFLMSVVVVVVFLASMIWTWDVVLSKMETTCVALLLIWSVKIETTFTLLPYSVDELYVMMLLDIPVVVVTCYVMVLRMEDEAMTVGLLVTVTLEPVIRSTVNSV